MRVIALDFGLRPHDDTSATCLVSVFHALKTVDVGSRGEVGRRNILHQSVCVDVGVVDVGTATVDNLAQIVRRHVRRHTHRNTVTAVHQQVRHLRRHHARLRQRVVEVVHHVHRVFLQVVHDVLTHLRQAALRVTHRSR